MKSYQNPLRLPLQNEHYGIGDPFVFKFNGKYYLYPSSAPSMDGVCAWESENMTDWRYLGLVAEDKFLNNAYAPEVFYYNGTFYLIASPKGEGHYIYTSKSPAGPFVRLTDNIGLTIDGSLFCDDDGTLYFTHAEYPAIHGHVMEPDGTMHSARELQGTSMGHWTEGPGIFKRDGRYYITMTGNHLLSRGYRIDYAVSEVGPLGPYRIPENKTLLVNTSYENGSLGHSSTVMGPDLDSYWIFYHCFPVSRDGKRHGRFVNMDRLLFYGNDIMVSGPSLTPVPVPEMPDFYGWADNDTYSDQFLHKDGFILSRKFMDAFGTAEISFAPNGGKAVFAYEDSANFHEASICDNMFYLYRIKGSQRELINEKELFKGFNQEALHTLRLESKPDCLNLFIDSLHIMELGNELGIRGHIGTRGSDIVSFIAFSKYVGQSGDGLHHQYLPGKIKAEIASVPVKLEGSYVSLSDKEALCYNVNVAYKGIYRVQAVMNVQTKCDISFGTNETKQQIKLMADSDMRRVDLGCIPLEQGLQVLQISVEQGIALFESFDVFPLAEHEFGEYSGLELCYRADIMEGDCCIKRMEGLQMDRPGQALARIGDRFHTDSCVETEVIFRGEHLELSAGIFLRLSENSVYIDQVKIGHRGYYIGFDTQDVFVWRMNFDKKILCRHRCKLQIDVSYKIKADFRGNRLSVFVDDLPILCLTDAISLPYGLSGVGSFGARVTFTRVKYNLE